MANRLITIPMSHYCEKARWALEYLDIDYQEERHLQGFHYLPSFRHAKSPTVPVLITPSATLKDSADILKWAHRNSKNSRTLYPKNPVLLTAVEQFERQMDTVFGPAGRLWLYTYMLEQIDVLLKYSRIHRIPDFEVNAMSIAFPFFRPFANWRLKMTPTSRMDAKLIVDAVLHEVAVTLESGQDFLFGNEFSAADLTFASLAAPALLPANYGVALPGLEELPIEMSDQIKTWRNHPAGIYALRLYESKRRATP